MDILILGAGGHGRVVLDILRTSADHNVIGFLDAEAALAGTEVGGLPVFGSINQLPKLRQRARGAIIAIGDNRARLGYATIVHQHGLELVNAIHPSAVVSSTVKLGRNIVIAAGAIVGTDTTLADSVIINTGAVVDHECEIAEAAHIAPGAHLAGRVRVGRGAFIGLGANIIPCMTIGEGAIIGAGAVILRDVPPRATAVGVPAQVIKVAPHSAE